MSLRWLVAVSADGDVDPPLRRDRRRSACRRSASGPGPRPGRSARPRGASDARRASGEPSARRARRLTRSAGSRGRLIGSGDRLLEQLRHPVGVAGDERLAAAASGPDVSGIAPPIQIHAADSSSSRSLIASERASARPSSSRSSAPDRQLGREDRALVLGQRELRERELVVPAEQPPIRLAERVADRRRVVDPADQRQLRVEDQRDGQVEPAPAVEPEVPRRDALAIRSRLRASGPARRASARRRPGAPWRRGRLMACRGV